MKVCGLDASTSVVGITILDDLNVLLMTHVDLTKCSTFWEKCDVIEDELKKVFELYNPEVVVIEEAVKKFRTGFSSANTISLLLRWNGIVSYMVYKLINVQPTYISAGESRKLAGMKMLSKAKSGGTSHKEQAFEWCMSGPLVAVDFPKTKTGKWKPFVYDIVDSYVLARAGVFQAHNKK
jgi:Holliday junction resolvasome RuvABC endonuclease subunit